MKDPYAYFALFSTPSVLALRLALVFRHRLYMVVLATIMTACASAPGGPLVVEEQSHSKHPQPVKSEPAKVMVDKSPPSEPAVVVELAPNTVAQDVTHPLPVEQEPAYLTEPAQAPLPKSKTPVATPARTLPVASQKVVEQLLTEADAAKAKGHPDIAIMKLQQAQRISPTEAKVYARLAALYLAQGQADRAEQMARKGLTLVAYQPAYGYYFWRLIAATRRYQGDAQGEAKALEEARQFQ